MGTKVGDISCGGLEIIMALEVLKFSERRNRQKGGRNSNKKWQTCKKGADF